jgi:hypothetical protein
VALLDKGNTTLLSVTDAIHQQVASKVGWTSDGFLGSLIVMGDGKRCEVRVTFKIIYQFKDSKR